jgi:AraC-like DNA-binding protein
VRFQRTLRMDELATGAHMSPSTFRRHFREIAGMSPLQYQKQLRLQEARQLMLNEKLDASVARDARGLRERVAVQSRVQSVVRCAASARYQAHATEPNIKTVAPRCVLRGNRLHGTRQKCCGLSRGVETSLWRCQRARLRSIQLQKALCRRSKQ